MQFKNHYFTIFFAIVAVIGAAKLITTFAETIDSTVDDRTTPKDFIRIPATDMTQSEAHMSVPAIRKTVESWYFINKNKPLQQLWTKVVAKERELNKTHRFFYHGLSNPWRVPGDFFLEMYKRFYPITMQIVNFRSFRWEMPLGEISPMEWLKKEIKEYGLVNDNEARLKSFLFSVNLALFGNTGFPGECTIEYIFDEKSQTKVGDWAFKGILDIFGATHEYIPELMALADKYLQAEVTLYIHDAVANYDDWQTRPAQTLCQIAVPNELVDEVAYIAWVQGIPFEEKLISWIRGQVDPKVGKHGSFTVTQKSLTDIRKLFKDKQEGHPVFKQILEGIEQGKYRVSKILHDYKNEPQYLGVALNELQARLVVTPGVIGSPGSGVQVFDYDFIPEKNKKAYERELKGIADKIFKERLSRAAKATTVVQQPPVETTVVMSA